jgi:hypothetical protein
MAFNEAGVPFCNGCRHYHIQGEKCAVCGHKGKCNIFGKMLERAKAHQSLRFWAMGSGLPNGCDMSNQVEQWAVLRELRGVIYLSHGGDDLRNEFNMVTECGSRHMMFTLGDKPIAAVRYQVHFFDSGSGYACTVDRFSFLQGCGYEERPGLVDQCVQDFLTDLRLVLQQHAQEAGADIRGPFFMQVDVKLGGVILQYLHQAGFTTRDSNDGCQILLEYSASASHTDESPSMP